jgi:glycerophosphoryl diester phosphodiesterase
MSSRPTCISPATNGSGDVRHRTLDELRKLDAAHHFSLDGVAHPHRGKGLAVPTLAEVVELAPALRLNLDLKPAGSRLVRALWRFIDDRGLHDRVLVASKHHRNVREFRALSRGRVATSASYREVRSFWSAVRLGLARLTKPAFDALQVPPHHRGLTVVDERLVAAAHARGVHVHVWTVDDPEAMLHWAELGVDGVMSDRPTLLGRVLGGARG